MGYNYITRRLAQGSAPENGVELSDKFDVVVLCAEEMQDIELPGVEVIHCPLNDGPPPTRAEVQRAWSAAQRVGRRLRRGKRVLVTCAMGWNRSGLVTGLVLRISGYTPREAVMKIRYARGVRALGNEHFVNLITQVTPVTTYERRATS